MQVQTVPSSPYQKQQSRRFCVANGGITKAFFETLDSNQKLDALFDQQVEIIDSLKGLQNGDVKAASCLAAQKKECDGRFKRLERLSWIALGIVLTLNVVVVPIIVYVTANHVISAAG